VGIAVGRALCRAESQVETFALSSEEPARRFEITPDCDIAHTVIEEALPPRLVIDMSKSNQRSHLA